MNLLRALIPCALHRGCWPDDDRMTVSEERISAMGASPSNLTSAGGITPPIQAYAPAAPAPVATEPLAGVRYTHTLLYFNSSISTFVKSFQAFSPSFEINFQRIILLINIFFSIIFTSISRLFYVHLVEWNLCPWNN